MTTEFVLLLAILGIFSGQFMKSGQAMLQSGVPKLAYRMEKHLITGNLFSQKIVGSEWKKEFE